MRTFLKVIKNQDNIIACSNDITETLDKKSIEKQKYFFQIEKKEQQINEILEKIRKEIKINKPKIDNLKQSLKEFEKNIDKLIEKKKIKNEKIKNRKNISKKQRLLNEIKNTYKLINRI